MNNIPSQYTLTPEFENLIRVYEKEAQKDDSNGKKVDVIKVTFMVSAAASIYETIRNAVEYREQHLLLRAAITRILKRLTYLQNAPEETAEGLIRELIWARYLPNETIPETKVKEITKIISDYLTLWHEYNKNIKENSGKRKIFNFIIELTSCEIEENLSTGEKREALYNFAYQVIRPHIEYNPKEVPEEEAELIIRTALRKALLKSDSVLLSYYLFKQYFPNWNKSGNDYSYTVKHLKAVHEKTKEIIEHKDTTKLFYYCRNNMPPFYVLEDALEKNPAQFREKAKNTGYLNKLIEKITQQKYSKIHKKLTLSTTRSIIYIFLTKMVFAFILEYPYERFVIDEINYRNLLINLIVPPIIMFLVTLTIRVPGQKNTNAIKEFVKSIIYKEISDNVIDYKGRKRVNKTKSVIFGLLYSLGFFATFGSIIWFLVKLDYNIISGLIFIFFLTLVSFFGFMIRQQIRDINLLKSAQSGIATLTDFFVFPIVRTGSLLSTTLAEINITTYIFDIFIEAPFKTIIQIFEEWFSFVRERKDEIV